jgi:NAD(P)H-dependent FMN reductase
VLKNPIDCASHPPEQPFDRKPIVLMGVTAGVIGTGRAQYRLRQCFVFLIGLVLNRAEAMIPHAQNRFDAHGKPTRPTSCDFTTPHTWLRSAAGLGGSYPDDPCQGGPRSAQGRVPFE